MSVQSATTDARAEFADFPTLRALFSISRSYAYFLEGQGKIKFVRLRGRGRVRGKVLVNLDSVRAFLSKP